jgi:beta-glucosidase
MKKALKITIKATGILVFLALVAAIAGWFYLKSTFLDFEDDYAEAKDLNELTIDDISFLDRNGNGKLDTYEDNRESMDDRVEDLLSQMTIEEKIHLLKGSGMASALGRLEPGEGIPGVVGTIVSTPRLGMPAINLSDGPAGLRIESTREDDESTYYCTAFPIATLLASTWNTDLAEEVGEAMGEEALEYGIDVILGPGANIHRHPFNGRNFEYYSEDPLLTGKIGAAIINGIESNGVGTSVKHFVANNQETNRNFNDVIISERALREIYLKGFEIIVKESQPWTIMSSYNKVNGSYVPENKRILTDILRDEWGFEGLVMTDWFGGNDAPATIRAGNDLLEPGTKKQWKALTAAYEEGNLSEETINISVRRILKLIIKSKKIENYAFNNTPDLKGHAAITRQSAAEGMTLLKNERSLPLKEVKNVALFGIYSYDLIAGGTGSGDVNEAYSISLDQGLNNAGFEINTLAKIVYQEHKAANEEGFVKREGFDAMLNPIIPPEMRYTDEQLKQIVKSTDIAIITIGRNSGEGGDRKEKDDFLLSDLEMDNLKRISTLFHKANKKVIVILNIGGVIETASWKALPDAILLAWQGGQEGGNAVADILRGKISPSGKLPMTFPKELEDHASHANFPLKGIPFDPMSMFFKSDNKSEDEKIRNEDYTMYDEGIYVGYRHFDKAALEVSYPFGYGLSYTDFELSDMQTTLENDTITVSLSVKNTGTVKGKEVVQIYTSKTNTTIDRAYQELKGFVKTKNLQPEQVERVTVKIPVSRLRYWDESKATWVLEKGNYKIAFGISSRDIKGALEVQL